MSTPHAASPTADQAATLKADEATVREGFWPKLRRVAGRLPFAEDLLAAYFCAIDRKTPLHVRAALMGALAYFVMPVDALPDFMAVMGYTDDAAVLLGAVRLVSGHVRASHRRAARRALDRLAGG